MLGNFVATVYLWGFLLEFLRPTGGHGMLERDCEDGGPAPGKDARIELTAVAAEDAEEEARAGADLHPEPSGAAPRAV